MSDKIPGMDYDTDEVIENFKSKFKWPGKDEVEVAVTPPNIGMKVVLSIVLTAVLSAVYYYATFPALNFKATEAYMFVVAVIAIFIAVFALLIGARTKVEAKVYAKKKSVIPIAIIIVILLVMAVGWLTGATLFRAKAYSKLMPIQSSNFSEDFESIKYDEVPRLDSATAKVLADQQLGQLDAVQVQLAEQQMCQCADGERQAEHADRPRLHRAAMVEHEKEGTAQQRQREDIIAVTDQPLQEAAAVCNEQRVDLEAADEREQREEEANQRPDLTADGLFRGRPRRRFRGCLGRRAALRGGCFLFSGACSHGSFHLRAEWKAGSPGRRQPSSNRRTSRISLCWRCSGAGAARSSRSPSRRPSPAGIWA